MSADEAALGLSRRDVPGQLGHGAGAVIDDAGCGSVSLQIDEQRVEEFLCGQPCRAGRGQLRELRRERGG